MKNCGQCDHFETSGYANWGTCCAPLPAWVNVEEIRDTVWVTAGHPHNHAERCDLFVLPSSGMRVLSAGLGIDAGYKEKYLSLSAQHVRETEMLLAIIEDIGIKADGGLCSMTFDDARAFLTDIKTQCEEITKSFG